jgi:hypothetical protein
LSIDCANGLLKFLVAYFAVRVIDDGDDHVRLLVP